MALFRKNQPDSEGSSSEQETLEGMRLREQIVTRRESEVQRREKTVHERQVELDRRSMEIVRRETELGRLEEKFQKKVVELKRFAADIASSPGAAAVIAAQTAARQATQQGGTGSGVLAMAPGAAGHSASGVSVLSNSGQMPSGASILGGSLVGNLPAHFDQRMAELQQREAWLNGEGRRLEELAAELDRRTSEMAVREARLQMQLQQGGALRQSDSALRNLPSDTTKTLELERLVAEFRRRESELLQREMAVAQGSGGGDSQLAQLLANQQLRTSELERQVSEARAREQQMLAQLNLQGNRGGDIERITGELRRQQAELSQRQELLDARQFELDKREVELLNLQNELRDKQQQLDRQRRNSDSSLLAGRAPHTVSEPLPDYVSEMSVLKADQLKLQERMLTGNHTTITEEMSTSVFS